MGERLAAHDVADRVDAVSERALRAVHLDQAALVELHAGLVEPEALDVGRRGRRRCRGSRTSRCSPPPGDLHAVVLRVDRLDVRARSRSFTFCLPISRAAARAMSLSSSGRICGSASSRCTSVPSRPNAMPPRCRTRRRRSRRAAGLLVEAPTSSRWRARACRTAGRAAASAPSRVARTTVAGLDLGAVELAADPHVAVVGDRRRSPRSRRSCSSSAASPTPPVSFLTTLSRCAPTPPKSTSVPDLDAEVGAVARLGRARRPRAAPPSRGCRRS